MEISCQYWSSTGVYRHCVCYWWLCNFLSARPILISEEIWGMNLLPICTSSILGTCWSSGRWMSASTSSSFCKRTLCVQRMSDANTSLWIEEIVNINLVLSDSLVIVQVEFNKAAQSLSEALVPTTKKAALTRLLKVSWVIIESP